jgi:hypothetical protein
MSPDTSFLLQRREKDAGGVTRVPLIQLEKLVVEAIRPKAQPDAEPKGRSFRPRDGRGLGTNAIIREARVTKPRVWRWQQA